MQCIGLVGIVHRVTERGDVRVQFDAINQRWTFHPRAIHRLSDFAIGDAVRLMDDALQVKLLQRGHGMIFFAHFLKRKSSLQNNFLKSTGEWVDVMISVKHISQSYQCYNNGI